MVAGASVFGLLHPVHVNPAFAAGEVITVTPGTVARGDFITVTISQISRSSFCDYLPYAGDGYYAEIYLFDYASNSGYYVFSQKSERFDPKAVQSITVRVGPIPASYPLGQVSVVGDCRHPDGRQTGNTAVPFSLSIVGEGAANGATPTPGPTEPTPAAPLETEAPAGIAADDTAASGGASLGPRSRTKPAAPKPLRFAVEKTGTGEQSRGIVLTGSLPDFTGRTTVELVGDNSTVLLADFNNDDGRVWEAISVGDDVQPGTYMLRALSWGSCGSTNQQCRATAEVAITVQDELIRVLDEELARGALERTTSSAALPLIVSGVGLIVVLGVLAFSFFGIRQEEIELEG